MANKSPWLNHPFSRSIQHLAFWVLSFIIFLQVFKGGQTVEKIDYVYTALFHTTLIPAVYINLLWLLPRLASNRRWPLYIVCVCGLILLFSWLNDAFFQNWSGKLLPNYFFISYFTYWEISLFFLVYLATTSLLKLSKSWFVVNELQRQLLQTEKEKVQMELRALKAQVNPHFFFNTLNGIYSMALDKDERLPGTVLRLSHLMRYFLYESKEDLVPFEKEWQVLQDYIGLQQIRSDGLWQIEKKFEGVIEQQQIPPFLLIIFVENAFKHGTAYIRLLLTIQGNDLTFRLENQKGMPVQEKGLGLENVRRRLELLYPGRHRLSIEDSDNQFTITLQLSL
jgi:sensor histidine kinase YesM